MQWTSGQQILPSGTRWRTAAASSSKQQQAAALQLQQQQDNNTQSSSRNTWQVRTNHTRTSYSSIQYNYHLPDPGTLLWNHTRCLTKKSWKNGTSKIHMEALRESNLRPHTLKECNLPSNHQLSPHTVPNNKRWQKTVHKKKCGSTHGIEPPTSYVLLRSAS